MAIGIAGGEGERASILEPLRLPRFRALWLATLVSNLGWLIQTVGAAWLMTALVGTADMVALVQAAVQAPILCFSILAGVAADLVDRRRVLLAAQLVMLAVSLLLALLAATGTIGPWSLLALTFLLGSGAALQGPAFQSVVREVVPIGALGAAVTLNGVSFNAARAVGPALGGAVVAWAGAQAAFLLNAVSYLPLVLALLLWKRPAAEDDLPRERVAGAVLGGFRYAAETPGIRAVLVRSALFAFAAAAALPLLPLLARDRLAGGAASYGILLGLFGLGAMASAFFVHGLRERHGAEPVSRALALLFAGGLGLLAFGPGWPPIALGLLACGAAWIGSFAAFNIAVQTSSAFWVQSRTFALYQTVMFGAMAAGSWVWGLLAARASVPVALATAALLLALQPLAGRIWPLPAASGRDLGPARRAPEPSPALAFDPEEGPVLVQVEYRVDPARAAAFAAAMDELGHIRKRNGALRWRLFQDTDDPEHWVETYVVADWVEHLRLARRTTEADRAVEREVAAFDRKGGPVVRRLVARRRDARFALDASERAGAQSSNGG
ncbi:MAG: MFS transporter [Geminicoccaceae bacterium]|nr:MFS transporter [Geminicoccaceae bacterium]MCX8102053.1 MFS transporter [Geminicoccaceae bacterium]MDW8370592.1 MFS transporter [Geminicoccaceae bacterium]